MEFDRWVRDPHSRKRFFAISGVSLGVGGAVFLGACGDDDEESTTAEGGDSGDSGDVDIIGGDGGSFTFNFDFGE